MSVKSKQFCADVFTTVHYVIHKALVSWYVGSGNVICYWYRHGVYNGMYKQLIYESRCKCYLEQQGEFREVLIGVVL